MICNQGCPKTIFSENKYILFSVTKDDYVYYIRSEEKIFQNQKLSDFDVHSPSSSSSVSALSQLAEVGGASLNPLTPGVSISGIRISESSTCHDFFNCGPPSFPRPSRGFRPPMLRFSAFFTGWSSLRLITWPYHLRMLSST